MKKITRRNSLFRLIIFFFAEGKRKNSRKQRSMKELLAAFFGFQIKINTGQ